MISRETIVCPNCEVPLPAAWVDWLHLEARCARCEATLILRDELMPTAPFEEVVNRCLRPNDLPAPERLSLKTEALPERTVLTLRGPLGLPQARISLDERQVEVRRFLARRSIPLNEIAAFLPIQTVWTDLVSDGAPQHTEWHIAGLTPLAEGVMLLPIGRWEPARYLAAKLNEALLRFRPRTPYRDDGPALTSSRPPPARTRRRPETG